LTENEIAKEIVDAAFKIHTTLGPGLLESVYEAVLTHELSSRGLPVERQKSMPVIYENVRLEEGFRADLMVSDKVIVELKSVEKVAPVHKKQLLTYLRLADKRLGLLINFGEARIRDGITRIVNKLTD
jgi:GxxExxY protein